MLITQVNPIHYTSKHHKLPRVQSLYQYRKSFNSKSPQQSSISNMKRIFYKNILQPNKHSPERREIVKLQIGKPTVKDEYYSQNTTNEQSCNQQNRNNKIKQIKNKQNNIDEFPFKRGKSLSMPKIIPFSRKILIKNTKNRKNILQFTFGNGKLI